MKECECDSSVKECASSRYQQYAPTWLTESDRSIIVKECDSGVTV